MTAHRSALIGVSMSARATSRSQPPGGPRTSVGPATTGGALPGLLAADDRRWLEGLAAGGVERERTCRELHAVLLRAAKFEVAQRRSAHHLGGADVDDIACQAASDA